MPRTITIELDDDLVEALDAWPSYGAELSREDILKHIVGFSLRRPPIDTGNGSYQAAERWDVGALQKNSLRLVYVLLRAANGNSLITTLTGQEAVMMADGLLRNAKRTEQLDA